MCCDSLCCWLRCVGVWLCAYWHLLFALHVVVLYSSSCCVWLRFVCGLAGCFVLVCCVALRVMCVVVTEFCFVL